MSAYTSIGKFKKPHGLQGELKCFVADTYLEDMVAANAVFVKENGLPAPYFVKEFRVGNQLVLSLEEVDDKEAAMRLTNKEIWLPTEQLIPEDEKVIEDDDLVFGKLVGYQLFDVETDRMIGAIKEVLDFPQQEMAVVEYQEQEVFIPLHDNLIEHIDDEKKEVRMNLPSGILTL